MLCRKIENLHDMLDQERLSLMQIPTYQATQGPYINASIPGAFIDQLRGTKWNRCHYWLVMLLFLGC